MKPRPGGHTELLIDALRGVAATIVLIHHITTQFPAATSGTMISAPISAMLVWIGDLNSEAVMLFFVISGFCIHGALTSRPLDVSGNLRTYAVRRAIRILPPYWMALAFTGVVGLSMAGLSLTAADEGLTWATLLGNLLFLQTSAAARGNWFVPFGGNGPLWSISYEVFYYLLFPALLILEARWKTRRTARSGFKPASLETAMMLSAGAILANAAAPNPLFSFIGLYAVWRAGAAAHECTQAPELRNRALMVIFLTAACLLAGQFVAPSATAVVLLRGLVIAFVWIAVQNVLFSHMNPVAEPILRGFARIGWISYSLYLVHFPILMWCRTVLGDHIWAAVVAVALSVVLAVMIEAIAMRLKGALLGSRQAAIAKQA